MYFFVIILLWGHFPLIIPEDYVDFLLGSLFIIASVYIMDNLLLIKGFIKHLNFVHILLSPQFLAEDYSLVDVLYYVTRDDLKCLRLRYHFSLCSVGMMERAGQRAGSPGSGPGWSLPSSNQL